MVGIVPPEAYKTLHSTVTTSTWLNHFIELKVVNKISEIRLIAHLKYVIKAHSGCVLTACASGYAPHRNEVLMAKIRTTRQIGSRLRELREQAGVSQEKLAELVGVSKGQLQKYESGKNMMNTEKLQLAAVALSVPVQDFFIEREDVLPLAISEKLLLDSYRAIPNKEIQESILKITANATKQG
jgi:transcriptional regulator with XRE-family HTH domain